MISRKHGIIEEIELERNGEHGNYTMVSLDTCPKARRQVQENLKFVDFVTVLVDARLPLSSQNPMLTKIVGDKPKLMIFEQGRLGRSCGNKRMAGLF